MLAARGAERGPKRPPKRSRKNRTKKTWKKTTKTCLSKRTGSAFLWGSFKIQVATRFKGVHVKYKWPHVGTHRERPAKKDETRTTLQHMVNSHGHGDEHDLTMWCGVRPRCARPPPRSPCISLFCMFVFLFVLSVCVASVISSLLTPWNASKSHSKMIPRCLKFSSKIHPKTTSKYFPKPFQNPLKMVLRWYLC